jgi:uncharacterized protein YwgA
MAYFATRAGIPTNLSFHRGSYGPFSNDVKPMVTRLVNNGLLREERVGQMLRVRPGTTYSDAIAAYRESLRDWEPLIDRVADLFMRMNTQRAEIAATVDFVARDLSAEMKRTPAETEVLEGVVQWKQRRRPPLDKNDVAEEIRALNLMGWLHLAPSPDLPVSTEAVLDV